MVRSALCGCKQWDIKGDGRTGLVVKKCVIIDSNQHVVSMENGRGQKIKEVLFLVSCWGAEMFLVDSLTSRHCGC